MTANAKLFNPPWIDPDDAPEITAQWVEEADVFKGEVLVRRGRPRSESPKQAIKIRLDPDLLIAIRATGSGWQTRVNDALREWMKLQPKA